MNESERYNSLIQFYSAKYGLNWYMIKKVIEVESSFNPNAVSPVGARGLAQFMTPTWREWNDRDYIPVDEVMMTDFVVALDQIGFSLNVELDASTEKRIKELIRSMMDNPHNPEEAIESMCKYLSYLLSRFMEIPVETERTKFALASYNAGRGNINKMLEFARIAAGSPKYYLDWKEDGQKPGEWQRWNFAKKYLVKVTGEHSKETLDYVEKIVGTNLL